MYQPFVDVWAEQERKLRDGDDVAGRADLVIENREGLERSHEETSFLQRVSGL
jgi:hypothetical protein